MVSGQLPLELGYQNFGNVPRIAPLVNITSSDSHEIQCELSRGVLPLFEKARVKNGGVHRAFALFAET
jgi:hypothetical protein